MEVNVVGYNSGLHHDLSNKKIEISHMTIQYGSYFGEEAKYEHSSYRVGYP
jgi:hypothetical protein